MRKNPRQSEKGCTDRIMRVNELLKREIASWIELHGLNEKGIDSDFCILKNGNTRINVKLRSNYETEINGQGPSITKSDIDELSS